MMFHTTLRCGKLDGKLNGYSALISNIKNTNENELNGKNTLKMKKKRKRAKSDRWKNSSQDRNNRRVIRSMQRDRASVGARKRWLCFEPEPLVHAFVAAREPTDDLNGAKRRASVGRQHNQLPLRSLTSESFRLLLSIPAKYSFPKKVQLATVGL